MGLLVNINDRDGMILLGDLIGAFIKAAGRKRPWMIALEGPLECGKSLIPLAVDRCFRPDRYEGEISRESKADDLTQGPVVFTNFLAAIHERKLSLDEGLLRFQSTAPDALVYIGSNVIKDHLDSDSSLIESFQAAALGDKSALLDMAFTIKWKQNMRRQISLSVRDADVEKEVTGLLATKFEL